MVYRCRECDERLDTGAMICECGSVFPEAVPPDNNEPGVTKWPAPLEPEGIHQKVAVAASAWDQINDTTKAILAGAFVVLLIIIAVLLNHHK